MNCIFRINKICKHNENLPGMGGVFNAINLHVYHYAGYSQRSFELYNPVKYVDPDGRDIILLNRSYGAFGFGHNAILIGDDTDGWIYYSKDGYSGNTRQKFSNLNEFLSENKKNTDYNYNRAWQIETTSTQDKEMHKDAYERYSKDYSVWAQDTDLVLKPSVDIDTEFPILERKQLSDNKSENCADLTGHLLKKHGFGDFLFKSSFGFTYPNKQFEKFKEAYSQGKEVEME